MSMFRRTSMCSKRRDRRSPIPVVIGVGVIILGFVLMRLIMNIQRISPHQMVGVPQPTAAQSAPAQQAPPAQAQASPQQKVQPQAPAATAAPVAPSRAPSPPPAAVVEAPKKSAPPAATAAPSVAPPAATSPPAFANASAAAKASPEVRRAEPVRPEDLAKAGATQATQATQKTTTEAQGPNQVAIKPLKKTYIKVVVDNESQQPAFERWISPSDGTVEFKGQKIAVRILDRDAIQIKKNGKPVAGGDEDVTVE